ncbi:HNH endonuclease [Anaeroglobus geminatus]
MFVVSKAPRLGQGGLLTTKNWQPLCKSCHDHKTMTEDRNVKYKY